ncbi:ribbon-helix-helix protein, CopG family [Sphingomonas sp. BK069]|uniref:ribbon-helix-helix protein, CopG family n=1 Tax=Sphingomonas sp. BK069 TaxID=2586979 RepID=UPI001618333A|nr:ribbon-helix-helix protein, CopG family [Sphingomonas sp. BK069]
MKRSKFARTVRFEPEHLQRLEQLAVDQNRSMAEILRSAIIQYLEGHQRFSASELRHLRVAEYTQVALDAIIREEHPELRDTLVLETDRRMERYHGAR